MRSWPLSASPVPGKSTVGRALRLHPKRPASAPAGCSFADLDLQHLSEAQMRGVRNKRISMIMQDRNVPAIGGLRG